MPCPWPQTSELTNFCEHDLCAWVVEPGNTWSNLGFILVGIWIWRQSRTSGPYLWWIGLVAVLTGLGSSIFHMTATRLGGDLDFAALFLGTGMMTALNTRRWLNWPFPRILAVFLGTTFILIAFSQSGLAPPRVVYAFGAPCLAIEFRLLLRDPVDYRQFGLAWLCMAVAFMFWWLDLSRTWCNPNNHFLSGHALWHLLSAASFFFLYRFYRQFHTLRP